MKLRTHLHYIPKHFALVLAFVVSSFTVMSVFAWGPNRPTYTVQKPADHVVFNSITNNPIDGDERNFARASVNGSWTDSVTVQPGRQYKIRMVVHNNAADNLKLSAKNTRAHVAIPASTATTISVSNFVSADNAKPRQVWDDVSFTSTRAFSLAYVPGSARIINNGYATGGKALGDSLATNVGAVLGYKTAGDGLIPGCFKYLTYVEYLVAPQFAPAADFRVEKTVRSSGAGSEFHESVTAKPGATVDYQIHFKNTGGSILKNVMIRDILPSKVAYVAGSTQLANDSGIRTIADGIAGPGTTIGSYQPGAGAYLKFTARIAAKDSLRCGSNSLKNTIVAETSAGTKRDTATVTVVKTCSSPPPTTPSTPTSTPPSTPTPTQPSNPAPAPSTPTPITQTRVCDEETGAIISVASASADDYLPANDELCAPPVDDESVGLIASTGTTALLGGLTGTSALGYSLYSYRVSRRSLLEKLLNRK